MRRAAAWAAGIGAAWGLAAYAVLWGHTPITVHRPFVLSATGTILLLPVRLILLGIGFVEERLVGHPFDFSRNNAWIGALAGVLGAAIALVTFMAVRSGRRVVSALARPPRAEPPSRPTR